MKIDLEKLKENLPTLTGADFISCENAITTRGITLFEARTNSEFLARVAAIALEIPVEEITMLPMHEFRNVTKVVFDFFFAPSATKTPAT